MKGNRVVIAYVDDWEGLYVNGDLETEDHRIRQHDFIDLIRKYKSFESIERMEVSEERIEELGFSFPQRLENI